MQAGAARRMQYSSCDECRRSRVLCDAMSRGAGGADRDDSLKLPSCTRCQRRHRPCTFKWIKDAKGKIPKRAAAAASSSESRRQKETPSAPMSPRVHQLRSRGSASPAVGVAAAAPVPNSTPRTPASASAAAHHDSLLILNWAGLCGATTPGPDSPSVSMSVRSARSFPASALSPDFAAPSPPQSETPRSPDTEWLSTIYREGFEAIFGSWMGRYSNPFLFGDSSTADRYVCISRLCGQLDQWMMEAAEDGQTGHRFREPLTAERHAAIDDSLRSTIAAFSARWIPLICSSVQLPPDTLHLAQRLWRHARRDMLRVINRPSYRSMLALFLFALTPIPSGITELEEADGISGQACVHAALQQIQTLRARQRNLQFSGSKVSPSSPAAAAVVASPDSIDTSSFINAESIAYWAALTFDTSASLTLNCRSLLSSGLFGFEAESCWRLVRTCAQMFSETTQRWQQHGDGGLGGMTDDRANQIIAAAASWKLLGWKLTAVFKEALRDGHDESEIHKAYLMVVDSVKEFNTTYRPFLEACMRRMQFLSQQTKLRWYSLMLHYHLSIMMFVDMIEATGRYDLLANLDDEVTDAESAVMNCLVFGLHNTFTLTVPSDVLSNASLRSGASDSGSMSVSVPLISIDPYPHHALAGVQLLRKAIRRDLGIGKMPEDTFTSLQATLDHILSLLPQSSKSVTAARSDPCEKFMR